MKHTQFFLFAAIAIVLCACEKKEYWDHQTPEHPSIAHLMCIEITKCPDNYLFGIALANANTGVYADRFEATDYTSDEVPIKLYTKGGLGLNGGMYAMMISGTDEDMMNFISYTDTVPMFRDGFSLIKTMTQ